METGWKKYVVKSFTRVVGSGNLHDLLIMRDPFLRQSSGKIQISTAATDDNV